MSPLDERDPDLDLGGWDCEGQEPLDLDDLDVTGETPDELNPDDARDLRIDDDLLDDLPEHPSSRSIETLDPGELL